MSQVPHHPLIGHRPGQARAGVRQRLRNRHPTPYAPGRSTTAEFNETETTAFLDGEWVTCTVSTRVHAARFIREVGVLEVQFPNGQKWSYPCTEGTAFGFAAAGSKGGYIYDEFDQKGVHGQSI